MKTGTRLGLVLTGVLITGLITVRLQARPQEKQAAPVPESARTVFALSAHPPKGAVTLIGGKADEMKENWVKRYTTEPANWTVGADGVATPQKSDITSKQEFGDCYAHVEFRTAADAEGKPIGHGNSGVGFQGRYEVQIFNSYGEKLEATGCAALYNQKAATVNASKKAGEWQTYDIVFRAPRFAPDGKVTEQPRATVFQNGIIVQNNAEFNGMTGIQYGQYKEMTKTGPLILQGDHDVVQFRNVWVVPL